MARIIGRSGSNVMHLERTLGIKLDIQKHGNSDDKYATPYDDGDFDSGTKEVPFSYEDLRSSILIKVDRRHAGEQADIYVDGEIITTSRVDGKGKIKFSKKSRASKMIANSDLDLAVVLRDH